MTLEAHYPLTEDTGNVALDYSGNGFNGTVENGAGPSGTGTVTGPFGNSAYTFDGSDDYISSSYGADFGTGDFSVSVWINLNATGQEARILSSIDTSYSDGWYLQTRNNNPVHFRFATVDAGTSTRVNHIVSGGSTDVWYHVVGVVNSGELQIYFNGEQKTTATTGQNVNNSLGTSIGATTDNGANINADISDARIYSRALSPQEVQALYQAGERSEAVFGVTDSTATAQSVSGGGGGGFYGGGSGGGSTGGGGGGTTY